MKPLIIAAVLLFLTMTGCTTTQQIRRPDGTIEYLIACGAGLGWNICYDKANEVCPTGYTTLSEDAGLNRKELRISCLTLNPTAALQPEPRAVSRESGTEPVGDAPSTGSGFLLSESGIVVTNFHVVEGREEINVVLPSTGFEGAARVVLQDRNNDIAILRLVGFDYGEHYADPIPYGLGQAADVELGEEVFTLGYPLGSLLGRTARLSIGNVNSLFGIQDDPRVFQVSNPLQPGNSGGPLLSRSGDLVGIIVSSLSAQYLYENAGIIPQNVNFAIKADYLHNLVVMLPEADDILPRRSSLGTLSLEDQVRLVTPFVATVIAR